MGLLDSKNTYFLEHLAMAASDVVQIKSRNMCLLLTL